MPHNSFSALQIWWLEQPTKEGLAPKNIKKHLIRCLQMDTGFLLNLLQKRNNVLEWDAEPER